MENTIMILMQGLLSTKLEHLSHMWTIEISSAGCVYLALFTTVLEHLIAKLATLQTRYFFLVNAWYLNGTLLLIY